MNKEYKQEVMDAIIVCGGTSKKNIKSILDDAQVYGLDKDEDTADAYKVLEDSIR